LARIHLYRLAAEVCVHVAYEFSAMMSSCSSGVDVLMPRPRT
jgi:hypothetical protein